MWIDKLQKVRIDQISNWLLSSCPPPASPPPARAVSTHSRCEESSPDSLRSSQQSAAKPRWKIESEKWNWKVKMKSLAAVGWKTKVKKWKWKETIESEQLAPVSWKTNVKEYDTGGAQPAHWHMGFHVAAPAGWRREAVASFSALQGPPVASEVKAQNQVAQWLRRLSPKNHPISQIG